MKFCIIFLPLFSSLLAAQQMAGPPAQLVPPEPPKPETVLATVDGRKLTYGELETYLNGLGPEQKKAALSNRKALVKQFALFMRLLDFSKSEKLDEMSPYKEAIETGRRQVLANAALDFKYRNIIVMPDDQKKFYETNKDRYTQAKVQVLYLGFVADPAAAAKDAPGKKFRNEEQAKAKAEEIRKQIKTREDFVKMVKEYSEDEATKSRDGDFGDIKKTDNIPMEIKQVIFSLKEGEVSGLIPQRNGFYIFRLDSVTSQPYESVKDSIYNEIKDQRTQLWIAEQNDRPIKIEDESFFADPKVPAKK
jgi:peptidyl-prolyl cis-trans isomerase C